MQRIINNWTFNEEVHRIRKTSHEAVFRDFSWYYDAEEVIQKRIFWNWENISKCGPNLGQNNEKLNH